jgi:predicted  nucleic acid-binding Zn-ribbon protein
MPHECVSCGDVFDDGSDEVFDGCPSCGGTKFFYVKEVAASETQSSEDVSASPDGDESTDPTSEAVPDTDEPETVAETQTGSGDDRGIVEADSEYERAFGGRLEEKDEPDELDETDETDDLKEVAESDAAAGFRRARADEARDELMDQFETIRIVEPGSYELNLMNLYEEDEKIIALQEDGRYQVSLPTGLDE